MSRLDAVDIVDHETVILHLEQSHKEAFRIVSPENGLVKIQLFASPNAGQLRLNESEIDQVIAGLQEARRRMAIYRGVTPT